MRFVTFEHTGHRHAGVILQETVVSLKTAGFSDLLSVLQGGTETFKTVESFLATPPGPATFPLSSVRLCAPIPKPPKILCMGLNYRDHAAEAKMELPKVPIIFA